MRGSDICEELNFAISSFIGRDKLVRQMGSSLTEEVDPLLWLYSVTDKKDIFAAVVNAWETPRMTPTSLAMKPKFRTKTMTLRCILHLRSKRGFFREALFALYACDLNSALRLIPFASEEDLCVLATSDITTIRRAAIREIVECLHRDLRSALTGGSVTTQSRHIPWPNRGLNKQVVQTVMTTICPNGSVEKKNIIRHANVLYKTLAAAFGSYNIIHPAPLVAATGQIIGGSQHDFRIHVLRRIDKAYVAISPPITSLPQIYESLPTCIGFDEFKGDDWTLHPQYNAKLESVWSTIQDRWCKAKCVVIPDFSGSMTEGMPRPINIAALMVVLCGGPWLTFGTKPVWKQLIGTTLLERLARLDTTDWSETIDMGTTWRLIPSDTRVVYIISDQPPKPGWEGPPLVWWHLKPGPVNIHFKAPNLTVVTGIDAALWEYMTTYVPEPLSFVEFMLTRPPYTDIHYLPPQLPLP